MGGGKPALSFITKASGRPPPRSGGREWRRDQVKTGFPFGGSCSSKAGLLFSQLMVPRRDSTDL